MVPDSIQSRAFEIAGTVSPRFRRARARRLVEGSGGLNELQHRLAEGCVNVSAPLVLVSQVARSGGTLLSQLFDGHSLLLAHPLELKIGYPDKQFWPPLDPRISPEENFVRLYEGTNKLLERGYSKGKQDTSKRNFFLIPWIQRDLFVHLWNRTPPASERDILDHYFTSYFNAWLNFRGEIAGARFVTGFVPMFLGESASMDAYWRAYPDGRVISILRSPLGWYPSAKRHRGRERFATLEKSTALWSASTEAMLREKRRAGDRVMVLDFGDLVERTEATMRMLCAWLGIDFEPILLQPTFNGAPIGANTNFEAIAPGVVSAEPARRESALTAEERSYLDMHCGALFARASQEAVTRVR